MTPELRAIMERVDQVEEQSFISLYNAAPAELNAGHFEEDGVSVIWLASYEDASFSTISGLGAAPDPDTMLENTIERCRAAGVKVIGLVSHPDLDSQINQEWLAARGFESYYDEQIWWRSLDGVAPQAEPRGVRIERATTDDRETFAAVLNEGFGGRSDAGLGRAFAHVIGKSGWIHYLVYVDDQPGAASALFIADRVADCFIAATRPAARQRGAQTALINRRLVDGREAGCDIATAQANASNASTRNFERRGFQPVYRRTIYARRLDGTI